MTVLLLAAALACAAAVAAAAQEVPATPPPGMEPEAPATLLPLRIGDVGVDLSLAGSWSARFAVGAGLLLLPGEPPRSFDGLPGIAPGVAFSQVPDLSLSLTLLERWFIEVSILGGFDDNSLLMGYRGDGDEPVRHVLLGTRDIGTAATPFLETPAQADGSLGLSALVVSGIGSNEAMLRWDATGEQHRLYLGADELLEERIGIASWVRGRFFILPDDDVQDLVVLLEDPAGTLVPAAPDGRRYRQAGPADAILDAAAGRVTLRKEWNGRVLVFYRTGGQAVGTDHFSMGVDALAGETGGLRDLSVPRVQFFFDMPDYLGEDMNRRAVDVTGVGTCLLLWQPGDLSPFQAANTYAISLEIPTDPSRVRAFLERTSPAAVPSLLFQVDTVEKTISLLVDRDFRAEPANWYPFWESPADEPINLLYGPGRDALAGLVDLELVVQALKPVDGYVLGSDVVPGSVRVTVNGLEEPRFTFDGPTGRITFQVGIAPSDRIEVRWRTAEAAISGGDLLFTWRDDIRLAENLHAWVAAGLRWNVGSGLTAGEPYARSGALIAAAGTEGTVGRFSWSVEAAGSFTNPDTTGVARLHGMEGDSLAVDLSEELAWPAAPPDPLGPLSFLIAANRGKLLYRDYRSYDAFGGVVLHDLAWPEAVLTDYASGGRPGPYEVLGSSAGAAVGRSLVLEFDLPNVGDWAGVQMPVVAGSLADLSSAKSIAVRMRGLDLVGTMQVHVEVGEVGEDLDDDGVLDAEPSATSTGFSFDDTANSAVLKVGAGPRREGNGQRDTEDRDGSGALTPEDSGRVATWAAVTVDGDGAWDVYTFLLDDAMRGRLEKTRSIRIIVERTAADPTGTLLIDRIAVAGSAFWAETTSGTVSVREVAEPLLDPLRDPGAGNRLADVQAEMMRRFHPVGEIQEVLETQWSGTGGADVIVTGYTARTTGGIVYDEAVLYVRGVSILPGGVTVAFSLLDADGCGAQWSLDATALADEAWHEVRASRRDGTVTLDGVVQPGTAVFDAVHDELARLRVVVGGSTDGVLYLDEVHLQDPRSYVGAGVRAEASWSHPGAVWQPGGVVALANLEVTQRLSAATAGFSSLYGTPSAGADVTSRTEIGADVLYARIAADVVLRGVDGAFEGSGGHRLTIPAAASPVTLSDSFSLSGTGEFSRADSLRIQPSGDLSVAVEARAVGTAQALAQSWTATLDVRPMDRLDLGLDLLLSQSSTGYPLADAWYGARWAREAGLLAPWHGGATIERLERLSARIDGGIGPIAGGFSIDGSATGFDYTALSRAQADRIDEDWSLSWQVSGEDADAVVLSLRYARSLTMSGPRAAGEPYRVEAADFFALLGGQRWFLLGVPVLEILLDDTDPILASWAGLERASWNPSLVISIERRAGTRVLDLLVPSSAELSLDRELERRGDLPRNEISIRPRLVSHALNLFGRLGSHPVADFYRTDEYRISLAATVAGGRVSDLALAEVSFEAYAGFLGFRDQSLTLVNAFTLGADARCAADDLQAADSLQATFSWTTRPTAGVRLPFLPESVARTGYLEHRESLDLDLAFGQEAAHPLTLLLGHETSLAYPDRGSLKAGLKAGFDVESLVASRALRFAIEASIEAKITF